MNAGSCPHCGRPIGTDREEQIARHLADLREWAAERRVWLGPAETVTEAVAAEMLGRAPSTLRHWRGTDGRLPWHRCGGRIRFRLEDIATFMAETAESR
jgi:hypothetical protein